VSLFPEAPERPFFDLPALPRWFTASGEQIAFAVLLSAAAVLRVAAVFQYRIDSDEPQHLHIVWAWTHGLLQYRDVFDNHMPLFHLLLAPLLRLVGERADTLIAMRLAVVPLYVLMMALTFRIAVHCYPRRTALWSTLVAALFPLFLLCSVEFRTDDLWTVFWLASIAFLVCGSLTLPRVAAAGLALGLAGAVSAKTTLLLLAIAVGALCVGAGPLAGTGRLRAGRYAAIFLAAFVVPPVAIALYFAGRGAWDPFVYGVITHNFVNHVRPERVILFPGLLLLIAVVARRATDSPRQLFLFVTTHFYAAALYCLWPLVEHEHWLPYFPLAAVTLVPMFFTYRRMVAIAIVEIALVIGVGALWRNETGEGLRVIEQMLQLTRPGETVMDLKGEAVFRQRAFFYVLEPFTKHRIYSGKIPDTIVADILRTRTMVAVQDHHGFPRPVRKFLRRNFVSVGAVRVAGRFLRPDEPAFQIDVPAEYAVVGEKNLFAGSIDGQHYDGPRYLTAGLHNISLPPGDGRYSLLWSRAAALGLTPFGQPQPRRYKPSLLPLVPRTQRGCYAKDHNGVQRGSLPGRHDQRGQRQASSQDSAARSRR
jgi:hypothetical protein